MARKARRVLTHRDGGGVKRILNVLPSSHSDRDWVFRNAVEAGVVAAADLPPAKDLREPWWAIGDQGGTGACVGWATADSLLRWHFVKAGRLDKKERLSMRFIWMAAKETDEFVTRPTTFIEDDGTSLKAALDIARHYGAVGEAVLPFKTGTLYPNPSNTFYALAAQRRIASYFNLGTNLADWRAWLAGKGPLLTRLGVDSTWDNASKTRGNLDVYFPGTIRGGHAVTIVGYTPDRFIVRNSWGIGWGDGGYAYASLGYAQAAFTETYGVAV